MNKGKGKKRDNKRAEAIKLIAAQFNRTPELIRLIINNPSYDYGNADEIRKAYKKKYNQLKQILA